MTEQDEYVKDTDNIQQPDKTPVPVRSPKSADKEKSRTENDEGRPLEIPRRWRVY